MVMIASGMGRVKGWAALVSTKYQTKIIRENVEGE
jgi:hypothetical protein